MGVFRGRLFFATATVLAAVAVAAEPGLARSVNISSAWLLPRNDFPVFYRHFRDRVTWFEADAVCQFHHAQLATVESNNQFEAIHGYLKELDVTENVWIGLKRNSEASEFTWTNYQPLARGGYFREQVPRSSDPVCVVADPTANFKWHSLHCGGPEVASFVCELPVPYWASKSNGCMTSTMEGMTVTFLPESPAIQLTKECYPGYSRNVTCKGNMKPSEIMEKLSCAGSNKLLKTFKPLKAILPDVKSTTTTTSSSAESDLEDYAIEMATISQYNDETFQSISKAMGRGSGGLVNMPQEMSVALEPIKSSGRGGYDANGIDSAYVGGVAEATTVGAAVTSADAEVATATGASTAAGKTVGAAAAVAKTTRGPTPKSAVDPATVATTKAAVTFTATTVVVPVATATVTAATTTAAAGPGKSTLTQTTSTAKAPAGTAAEKTSTLATSESRPTTTVTTTTFAVADGHHHHHHRRPSAGAPTAEKVRTVVATATPTTVVTPTVVTAAIVHHQYVDDVTARVPTTGNERRDPTPVAGTPRRVYKKIDLPVVPQPNYEAKPVAATATAAIAGTPATIAGKPATIAGKPATIAGTPATIAGKLAVIAKQLTPPATVANTVTSQTATAPTVGGPPDDDNSTVAAASEASDDKNSSPSSPSSSSPSTSPTAEVPTAEVATVAEVANGTVITKTVATDATSAAAATDVTTTPASVATAAATTTNNPHRKMKNYDAFTEHPNRSRHIGRPKQQQHHHTYPYILYRLLG